MARSHSVSSAPAVELRSKIAATFPLRARLSSSLSVLAVRTMMGIVRVSSSERSASTTSKPLTPGLIRASRTRLGQGDDAVDVCRLLIGHEPPDIGALRFGGERELAEP